MGHHCNEEQGILAYKTFLFVSIESLWNLHDVLECCIVIDDQNTSLITITTLKRKCRHFDEIFITGCTGSCHFDNFQCSQWWKFHQNEDISVSVNACIWLYMIVYDCIWLYMTFWWDTYILDSQNMVRSVTFFHFTWARRWYTWFQKYCSLFVAMLNKHRIIHGLSWIFCPKGGASPLIFTTDSPPQWWSNVHFIYWFPVN